VRKTWKSVRYNKTVSLHTTLYYNNPRSYMFRLYETATIRLHILEICKTEIMYLQLYIEQ
jgi:hypothetical protein